MPDEPEMSITSVYKTIWDICKLPRTYSRCSNRIIHYDGLPDVRSLIILHLFCKVGFQANDSVTSLKMIEKGLGREDLAIVVLIDFPFQIIGGWLAARWASGKKPLRPWIWAFWPRLAFAFMSMLIVYWFPAPPLSFVFLVFLVIQTVLQGFSSSVAFLLLHITESHQIAERFNLLASLHFTRESLTR